jgi:hypothetical protein
MKRIILALVSSLILTGAFAAPKKAPPGSPPAAPIAAAPAADPVADFKRLVASASEPKEWSQVRQHSKTGKWSKQYYSVGQVKFDVKKTDSLVSPAMGIVAFPVEVRQSEFFDTEQEAQGSTALSKLRMTFFYSGKYLLDGANWQVDRFSYNASFGDNPPDPTTATLPREKLIADRDAGTGEAQILAKWIR